MRNSRPATFQKKTAREGKTIEMLYKVINQFKKEDDVESWNNYIKFSGLSQITLVQNRIVC